MLKFIAFIILYFCFDVYTMDIITIAESCIANRGHHLADIIFQSQREKCKDEIYFLWKLRMDARRKDNPNYVRDRHRWIMKPEMPPLYTDRYKPLYDPAWMDYCDPYHCNDYHKEACGLNRRHMKFRYFQSTCHMILNNQCSYYRGFLKYDWVELKHCRVYVMYLRMSCPADCRDEEVDPVCGTSVSRGHTVLFINSCALNAANCRNVTEHEYEEVDMNFCEEYLRLP